jgi:hypothetical protein
MPDITMCQDDECPLRDTCWRYTATPHPGYQSYWMTSPRPEGQDGCRYYWPVDGGGGNGEVKSPNTDSPSW